MMPFAQAAMRFAALGQVFATTALIATLLACGGDDDGDETARTVSSLRYIGQQVIANDTQVNGTLVGGLSGIDYDGRGRWYLISDDRSEYSPARFYTASLAYDEHRFAAVRINAAITLQQADGTVYPDRRLGGIVVDPEAIRVDPRDGSIWWSSEGERPRNVSPLVAQSSTDGKRLKTLPLPGLFNVNATKEKGSRNNAAFEGLTFASDGASLWVASEGPIYEDGALPTRTSGAVSRMTQYDRAGNVMTQYAYPIDALPVVPGTGMLADNGVAEILAIDVDHFIVVERSGVQGPDGNYSMYIRIYKMQIGAATNVAAIATLQPGAYKPLTKTLLLNVNDLGLPKVDNIEGVAWGPVLPNGRNSLVLLSDNNFNAATQITQLLAFEVVP